MAGAVFSHIQSIGLKDFYLKNFTFFELVYKFHALAYVPEAEMFRLFNEQILTLYKSLVDPINGDPEWIRESQKLGQFFDYLEFWFGAKKWNPTKKVHIRRRPIYPLNLWNKYLDVETSISTNNQLEAFNRTWNTQVTPIERFNIDLKIRSF